MRLSPLISLLLLLILVHEAQGIRLKKVSLSTTHRKFHHEDAPIVRRKLNVGAEDIPLCQNEHCSGRNRKLMTKTTSTSSITTTSENNKGEGKKADPKLEVQSSSETLGRKEENFSVNSSPVTENRETSPQRYPDILDIAGMDYSPAKRKPPIHN